MAEVEARDGVARLTWDKGAEVDLDAVIAALHAARVWVRGIGLPGLAPRRELERLAALPAGGEPVALLQHPAKARALVALAQLRDLFLAEPIRRGERARSLAIAGDPRLHELFDLLDAHVALLDAVGAATPATPAAISIAPAEARAFAAYAGLLATVERTAAAALARLADDDARASERRRYQNLRATVAPLAALTAALARSAK